MQSMLSLFETDTILIAHGKTTNVLLKTKPSYLSASFFMSARPYATGQGTFDNTTVAGILEYEPPVKTSIKNLQLFKLVPPVLNDTNFATKFSNKLQSLNSKAFPKNVPLKVDRKFFFTVGLGTNPCNHKNNQICQGPSNTTMFVASISNISFTMPTKALLQSHYYGQSNRVYSPNFPLNPIVPFNYTGTPPNNTMVSTETNVMFYITTPVWSW